MLLLVYKNNISIGNEGVWGYPQQLFHKKPGLYTKKLTKNPKQRLNIGLTINGYG